MSTTPIGYISPSIKVGGTTISVTAQRALISLEVDRSLNLIGRATLRFLEGAFDVSVQPTFTIGTEVEIGAPDGPSLFVGTVTGYSLDQEADGPAGTTLTAYTGPSTVTTPNTVIDGKTIGCITVSATGVVIRNSRIACSNFYALQVKGSGSLLIEAPS